VVFIVYVMFAIVYEVENGIVIDKNYVEYFSGFEGVGFVIYVIDG